MKKPINWKKYLLPSLLIFFCLIFLVSGGYLLKYILDSNKQSTQNDDLASMVEQIQQQIQQEQQQQTGSWQAGSSTRTPSTMGSTASTTAVGRLAVIRVRPSGSPSRVRLV